jgi:hypothetical protein
MIDITNAKASTLARVPFGHLLLCWDNGRRYCGIRVVIVGEEPGLLAFHAPCGTAGTVAAVLYNEPPNPDLCLDIGSAVVRSLDKDPVWARAAPGNIIVDGEGISIHCKVATDPDNKRFAQLKDQGAWRLANGRPQSGNSSAQLVIPDWEIGVRVGDWEFVQFATFPASAGR